MKQSDWHLIIAAIALSMSLWTFVSVANQMSETKQAIFNVIQSRTIASEVRK